MRHMSQVESEVQFSSEENTGSVFTSEDVFPDITTVVVGVVVLVEEVGLALFPQAESIKSDTIRTAPYFTFVLSK